MRQIGGARLATILAVASLVLPFAASRSANAAAPAAFRLGAAVGDFTPPPFGHATGGDPADCIAGTPLEAVYNGPRPFAYEEPYIDLQHSGHYDAGDPFVDCNGNGRWEGNFIGGGGNAPRFATRISDPVTARAIAVSNGGSTIAVEVLDHEGFFNAYQKQIRDRVANDGYHLDGIFISATHDESAPDSLGLYGVNSATSSVNDYETAHIVTVGAQAIEAAWRQMRPATIRYTEALEPANLRQCWSSYPFVDDQIMPVLQAVATDGSVIATLASVSQHAESLGFNPDPVENLWYSADWPYWFRRHLEARYGGIGIEMAGSVGSVETPEVFPAPLSRAPQKFVDEDHPAACRTLFAAAGAHAPLGYTRETRLLGEDLAGAVEAAVDRGAVSSGSAAIWGARADVCIPLSNALFTAGAVAGIFAHRQGYAPGCSLALPVAPNGSTVGNGILTQVAAFQIGDATFLALPGEIFPFTYLRGFAGPQDMPFPQYPLPPWLMAHLHTPFRFLDGLAEDMIGYVFPRGNGVGVPGEYPVTNPTASGDDRFGCGHSDDSESANSQAADFIGNAAVQLLDAHYGPPETIVTGRYVLPGGRLSRDPLGGPELKCHVDSTFSPGGTAVAVWQANGGVTLPVRWLSLSGRAQDSPDRNTRGYIDADGTPRWLDVFPEIAGAPEQVSVQSAAAPRVTGVAALPSTEPSSSPATGIASVLGLLFLFSFRRRRR